MAPLTYQKPNGEWGIEGVDLTTLPPKVYGALCKLHDLERNEDVAIEHLAKMCGVSVVDLDEFIHGPVLHIDHQDPGPDDGSGGGGAMAHMGSGGSGGCGRPMRLISLTADRVLELEQAQIAGGLMVLPPDKVQWVKAILAERNRQDQKWGFPQKNTYCEWASILEEEAGELCKELNELNFGRGDSEKMAAEAVQVAAVALAILEQQNVTMQVTLQVAKALGRICPSVPTEGEGVTDDVH